MTSTLTTATKLMLAGKPHDAADALLDKADDTASGRRLGAVVNQIRAAEALMMNPFSLSGHAAPSTPPVIPAGAQYLRRTHDCAAGSRDYMLYLPADHPKGPTGLVVMLHGCSQDPDDFASGTDMNAVAQQHGLAVAWPAQTDGDNASSCWNWFSPDSQDRDAGEPQIIATLAQSLMDEFGLDRTRTFIAGLSAGGAMAAILADTYPDVFSAAGVHSGLARGAATGVLSAASAMRSGAKAVNFAPIEDREAAGPDHAVRRIIFHGDDDHTVHPSNAPQIVTEALGKRDPSSINPDSASGRDYVRSDYVAPDGSVVVELWQIKGAGHAWSGGKAGGSYADAKGPDASTEMVRFFLAPPA